MHFYQAHIPSEIDRVKAYASNLRAKFDAGVAASDLLVDARNLEHLYEALCKQLPGDVKLAGSFGRHLWYMLKHLGTGDPDYCRTDIDDICDLDLPAIEAAFQQWCSAPDHVDKEIEDKVYGLLLRGEYDSAIRKGFVILKERMCAVYGVSKDKDGSELANTVYGKDSRHTSALANHERQAMRNLVDGLFGVFRNKYGHNDVEPPWHEVDAVLSMINFVLKSLPALQLGGKPLRAAASKSRVGPLYG